ncbi:hypothetical protein [Burkholderia ambifaria]|uniref:hypothetical protein n=1 Tax=Burkholderia ambifaria TaxID=152480 RepID=UPI001C934F42|nr:hypothetical protein [Burkholderia ambifaria]MBY4770657.1 hypothetical protein [Burkholderia ambifaria]
MTLPALPPMSMSQIAAELGRTLPLSLLDSWVLALAGKSGAPVSFSDLLGKTGRFDGALTGQDTGGVALFVNFPASTPFFDTTLVTLEKDTTPQTVLTTSAPSAHWSGNIRAINNTTGVSVVMSKFSATQWVTPSAPANLIRSGHTDSFTILPSA